MRLTVFLTVFGLLVSASPVGAERINVGAVQRVQNQAEAVYVNEVRRLGLTSPVLFDDLLRTGDDARLLAALADGSELTLGANANILVDNFVYDPSTKEGALGLSVLSGAFLFVGGQIESIPGNKVWIDTPIATLGIRGTTVWGGPTDGGFGVMVIDGEVDVTNGAGTVTVRAGEATIVADIDTAPMPAGTWGEQRVTAAVATVTFDE